MMKYSAERTICNKQGFSLVELLLVISIIGILTTVVVVNLGGVGEQAKIEQTRASIKAIGSAVEVYKVRTGTGLPGSMDDLTKKIGDKPALLKKDNINDAWGNPFQYKKISKYEYEIRSSGPDGQMGGEDDIIN